jgi:hypothetical protein
MSQQVVFNYARVSLKVPTTLLTPYSYPMSHHSHSFVKWPKMVGNRLLMILTSITSYSKYKYNGKGLNDFDLVEPSWDKEETFENIL